MAIPFDYFFGPDGPGDNPPDDFHWHDFCADDCDDQLPAIANVGRGLQGNGFYVSISDPDSCSETHLQGWKENGTTGERVLQWTSENINGGELSYQYNLRPYTNPQTFTITFIYRRPGRCEWSWTTPAIPYLWDANGDGDPDVDGIIGSGVGDLYIRTASKDYSDLINGQNPKDDAWIEKLIFPPGTTAKDFNSPAPLHPWTVNLTFGLDGGDVLVPNVYDLAKNFGFSADAIVKAAKGTKGQYDGEDNLKDYIDRLGGQLDSMQGDIDNLKKIVNNILKSLGDIIYGATTNPDGTISIPSGTKVPTGNINVFSGSTANYIRTRAGEVNNDIKAM